MKSSNITLGTILVIAGALLLLNNFDLLRFNFHELIKFWPLLLVYSGLMLLGGNRKGPGTAIAMVLITLTFVVIYFFFRNQGWNVI